MREDDLVRLYSKGHALTALPFLHHTAYSNSLTVSTRPQDLATLPLVILRLNPHSPFPSLSTAPTLPMTVARRAHRRMTVELEIQTLSVTFQALPMMRGAAQSARIEAPLVHVSLLLDLQQLAPAATLPAR